MPSPAAVPLGEIKDDYFSIFEHLLEVDRTFRGTGEVLEDASEEEFCRAFV